MRFVQIVEMETNKPDEMDKVYAEWLTLTEGKRTVMREFHTQDRDKPTHFVEIVEFPSYEQAMVNSNLPETKRLSERMRELCTAPPRFMNLDVLREDEAQGAFDPMR